MPPHHCHNLLRPEFLLKVVAGEVLHEVDRLAVTIGIFDTKRADGLDRFDGSLVQLKVAFSDAYQRSTHGFLDVVALLVNRRLDVRNAGEAVFVIEGLVFGGLGQVIEHEVSAAAADFIFALGPVGGEIEGVGGLGERGTAGGEDVGQHAAI